MIVHFASRDQLDDLFKLFAKPFGHHDEIDWIAPAWWYAMYATATR
jgi:hypothetical protein